MISIKPACCNAKHVYILVLLEFISGVILWTLSCNMVFLRAALYQFEHVNTFSFILFLKVRWKCLLCTLFRRLAISIGWLFMTFCVCSWLFYGLLVRVMQQQWPRRLLHQTVMFSTTRIGSADRMSSANIYPLWWLDRRRKSPCPVLECSAVI